MEIVLLLGSVLFGFGVSPWLLSRLARRLQAVRAGLGWSALAVLATILLSLALSSVAAFYGQPLLGAGVSLLLAGGTMAGILGLGYLKGIGAFLLTLAGSLAITSLLFLGLGLIYGVEDITGLYDRLFADAGSSTPIAADGQGTPDITPVQGLRATAVRLCECGTQSTCLSEHYEAFLASLDSLEEASLSEDEVTAVDEAQARATRCFFQPEAGD